MTFLPDLNVLLAYSAVASCGASYQRGRDRRHRSSDHARNFRALRVDASSVIASAAKQSSSWDFLDCFVAGAPRNDAERSPGMTIQVVAGGLNGLFDGGGNAGRANTGLQKPAFHPATAQ